jgi:hypothetical protein
MLTVDTSSTNALLAATKYDIFRVYVYWDVLLEWFFYLEIVASEVATETSSTSSTSSTSNNTAWITYNPDNADCRWLDQDTTNSTFNLYASGPYLSNWVFANETANVTQINFTAVLTNELAVDASDLSHYKNIVSVENYYNGSWSSEFFLTLSDVSKGYDNLVYSMTLNFLDSSSGATY